MHTCHAYDCNVRTKPEMFMCFRHWRKLPRHMQQSIWATYRPGQCDDWRISRAYADAAKTAIKHIAQLEGKSVAETDPKLKLYDLLTEVAR